MQTLLIILTLSFIGMAIIGFAKPELLTDKKTGEIPKRKEIFFGGMLAAIICAGLSVLFEEKVSSNDFAPVASTTQQEVSSETVPIVPAHNYSMKDGFEYGYEQALSKNQEDAGQIATSLLMFKYSGVRDGIYQAYSKQNKYLTMLLECSNPCEYIKIMQYVQGEGVTSVERIKAVEGTIAYGVMQDAINGHLEEYVGEKDGKKFKVWLNKTKPDITYLD